MTHVRAVPLILIFCTATTSLKKTHEHDHWTRVRLVERNHGILRVLGCFGFELSPKVFLCSTGTRFQHVNYKSQHVYASNSSSLRPMSNCCATMPSVSCMPMKSVQEYVDQTYTAFHLMLTSNLSRIQQNRRLGLHLVCVHWLATSCPTNSFPFCDSSSQCMASP